MIEKFRNLKLVFKTTIILATVLGTMLLCINIFSAIYTRTIVINKVNEQLENSLHEVINTVALYDKLLENTTQSLFNTFESTFQTIELDENQTVLVKGVQTPLLSDNGIMLNNNEMYVDDYASLEGATATIFVRNKDNFTRIATSLKKEDGSRSTGTNLSKNSAAYHAIINKKQYVGTATLFGKEYMTIYKPIIKNNKIIGILYVGFDYTKSFQELLTNLKKIKIGKSGYLYILSTFSKNKGKFIIHPLFQNKNIADYNHYLFKNIFLSNKGIITYNWQGTEKEAIYEDYPSRHWKIVLGSNKNEFLEESNEFSIILAIISIIAILIINACIFFIVRKIIIFPLNNLQAGLNDFFNFLNGENKKINEIPIQSNDEIGLMSKLINQNIKDSEKNIEIDNQLIMNTTQVANQVNEGILTARIEKSSNNEILNNLKKVINEMLNNTEKKHKQCTKCPK